ncbi:C25 family cysteine peptidase, partial [Candidatus Electronema sp. JM]|uniref:C25 family cysteine peptidase n=1 Tax=Candidatus Electronema sp. JM TaxID=3401571 RepID=UPI003AA82F15
CAYTPNAGYTGTDSYTYQVCLANPNQSVCDTATVTITVPSNPTYALISSFKAYLDEQNRVVLEWTTDSETGTIGFVLERLNEKTGGYEAVSELLPGTLNPPMGGTYRYVDASAVPGKQHTYRVIEEAVNAQGTVAGPFTVKPEQRLPVSKAMAADSSVAGYSLARKEVADKQLEKFAAMAQVEQTLAVQKKSKTGNLLKLAVAKDGLVRLTADELAAAAGMKKQQAVQHLKAKKCLVTAQGKPVPVLFSANGAALWFYGQAPKRNDIGQMVYWIELGKKGLTMDVAPQAVGEGRAVTEPSFADRARAEENHMPFHLYINKPVRDFWAWEYLFASRKEATTTHFVTTPDFTGSGDAELTVNLVNISSRKTGDKAPYKVSLVFNGTALGGAEIAETGDWQIRKAVPANLLKASNEVKIVSQLNSGVAYSLIYLDSIEVAYQRNYQAQQGELMFGSGQSNRVNVGGFSGSTVLALDITHPDNPVRVRTELRQDQNGGQTAVVATKPDHRYFVTENISPAAGALTVDRASSLRSTANKADYLIISPLHLLDSAKRLAEYRKGQGLTAMAVDIEDVQDEFSSGLAAPEAVHDFLAYVYAKWERAPKFVVLIGDGSYDYKNYLVKGEGYPNNGWPLVPSVLVQTPDGFFPSDSALADVVGNDGVPEFAVGRIPVFDKTALERYIDKVIRYEQSPHAGSKTLTIMNDKSDPAAGDFKASADQVVGLMPEQITVKRLDVDTLGNTTASSQLKTSMRQGTGIVHYIGHSSLIGWGRSNALLTADDIKKMSDPVGPPALMVSMSCSSASFGYPLLNSLGESAVLRADGGAAVFFGATGLSRNYLADIMAEGFYRSLFSEEQPTVGEAVVQGKQAYVKEKKGADVYILDIYNLLGDPAVRMPTQQQ